MKQWFPFIVWMFPIIKYHSVILLINWCNITPIQNNLNLRFIVYTTFNKSMKILTTHVTKYGSKFTRVTLGCNCNKTSSGNFMYSSLIKWLNIRECFQRRCQCFLCFVICNVTWRASSHEQTKETPVDIQTYEHVQVENP